LTADLLPNFSQISFTTLAHHSILHNYITRQTPTYVFLSEVDEVLQVDVVAVRPDVVVDEQVELVLDPVLEHEGQHPGGQLQEEDDAQEHRELRRESASILNALPMPFLIILFL